MAARQKLTVEQNFPDNVLYEMDNLDVLRGMNSETVDLIATDPPFNTRRNRAATAGQYVDNWRWGSSDKLPDQWKWNEVHPKWLEDIEADNPKVKWAIDAARETHDDGLAAFLCFLGVRLMEMHRILKATGSIYVHLDDTAASYVQMIMDAIFGHQQHRNTITWERALGRSDGRRWGRVSDTILFYTKSEQYAWHDQFIPPEKPKDKIDNLMGPGTSKGESGEAWRGCDPTDYGRCWSVPKTGRFAEWVEAHQISGYRSIKSVHDRLEALDDAGLIHWAASGVPYLIRPAASQLGRRINSVWTDVNMLGRVSNERTGSPDQKPLKLYERMVLASSNEGDLVLDPFAGCATTIIAARNHKRRWVGIDRRPDAREHIVLRLMSLKRKEADELRNSLLPVSWFEKRLAQFDARYATEAPVRTDHGETAASPLPSVYDDSPSVMRKAHMVNLLIERYGLQCWGCDFVAPDQRYLDLDHIRPKSDGGSNQIYNRALLCRPCNGAKSNRMTLSDLRNANRKAGYLKGNHPIDLQDAGAWAEAAFHEFLREQAQSGG